MEKANFNKNTDTVSAIDEVIRLGILSLDNGANLNDFLAAIFEQGKELEKALESDLKAQYGDKI